MKPRLLGDENTSHKLLAACQRLRPGFPLVHLATHDPAWIGFTDDDLLDTCQTAGFVLVSRDRRTLGEAARRAIRDRAGHAGIILFRRFVRADDYGRQARELVAFWTEAAAWDWSNRMAYIPRTTS
jgi:hypothetical protein